MLSEDKMGEKPRQRGRKRERKATRQESAQSLPPQADQIDKADGVVAAAEAEPAAGEGVVIADTSPVEIPLAEEVAVADASPTTAIVPASENTPVNMQTIANAYRDYTRKSLQANRSYVEQMMDARSVGKAVEVQTDFARQAYANFVTDSLNICALYRELAKQAFMPGRASRPG